MNFTCHVIGVLLHLSLALAISYEDAVTGYYQAVMTNAVYYDDQFQNICLFSHVESFYSQQAAGNDQMRGDMYQSNDNTTLIFAFRGISDAEQGLDILNADAVPLFDDNNDIKVAKIFKEWANGFQEFVASKMSNQNVTSVHFAGHSAGGGTVYVLAALVVMNHQDIAWKLDQVVTFGSPKPGDGDFRDWFNENLQDVGDYRFVGIRKRFLNDREDIVPDTPIGPSYEHTVKQIDLECKGDNCSVRDLHRMTKYLEGLKRESGGNCPQ